MKKTIIALASGLVLTLGLACFAACGGDQGNGGGTGGGNTDNSQTDYGSLSIADVTVYYRENATITPEFSTEAGKGEITYSFQGKNITITGNSVKGNTGNTSTTVTAKTAHHEVTFKVNVIFKNPFGKHAALDEGENVFKAIDNGVYEKTKGEYGASYYYGASGALKGNGKLLTGNAAMTETEENSYFDVVVKESATKAVRFVYTANADDTYTLTSEYMDGENSYGHAETLRTFDYSDVEIAVMSEGGAAYIFIDKAYCGKVDIGLGDDAHIGVGAANCALTLEMVRDYGNTDEKYADYLAETTRAFGDHIYADLVSDNIFAETETAGEYEKTSRNFGRAFPYADGLPIGGTEWAAEFTVTMSDFDNSKMAQVVIPIFMDEGNYVRFAVERRTGESNNVICIFRDIQTNTSWSGWTPIKEWNSGDPSVTIKFKVAYKDGISYLWINDKYAASYTRDMGNTQLAIGGENCTITISGLTRKEVVLPETERKPVNYAVEALPFRRSDAAETNFLDEKDGD